MFHWVFPKHLCYHRLRQFIVVGGTTHEVTAVAGGRCIARPMIAMQVIALRNRVDVAVPETRSVTRCTPHAYGGYTTYAWY